jgi:hypothetical protein
MAAKQEMIEILLKVLPGAGYKRFDVLWFGKIRRYYGQFESGAFGFYYFLDALDCRFVTRHGIMREHRKENDPPHRVVRGSGWPGRSKDSDIAWPARRASPCGLATKLELGGMTTSGEPWGDQML